MRVITLLTRISLGVGVLLILVEGFLIKGAPVVPRISDGHVRKVTFDFGTVYLTDAQYYVMVAAGVCVLAYIALSTIKATLRGKGKGVR